MSHDRNKSHGCKMVDLNSYTLRDLRVDNNLLKRLNSMLAVT